jgi:hypothetical protein
MRGPLREELAPPEAEKRDLLHDFPEGLQGIFRGADLIRGQDLTDGLIHGGSPQRISVAVSQARQAPRLQRAVALGELIDPLGGQGSDGAGVDPQVLLQEPAHLGNGRDRGAAHRDDLVGQGFSGEAMRNAWSFSASTRTIPAS